MMQDLLPAVPLPEVDSFSAAVAHRPLLLQQDSLQGAMQEEPSGCQNKEEQDTLMLFALPATVLEAATSGRPARYAN